MANGPRAFLCMLCAVAATTACTRTGFESWEFDAALPLEQVPDAARADQASSDSQVEDTGLPTTGTLTFGATSNPPFAGATTSEVDVSSAGAQLATEPVIRALSATLPAPINSAAATVVGNVTYVAGGNDTFPSRYGNCRTDILAIDASLGTVTKVGDLPVENQGLGLLQHPDGNLYSFMGYANDSPVEEENKVYRLQPGIAAPTAIGTFIDTDYNFVSGIMAGSNSASHLLVVAGGFGSGPLRDTVQWFDPVTCTSNRLTPRFASARCLQAGAVVNEVFYLFGGNTESSCLLPAPSASPLLDEIVAVRMVPEQVTTLSVRLPVPTAAACAVARSDGWILIFGGVHYEAGVPVATSDIYKFDPHGPAVYPSPQSLPAPRAAMACVRTAGGPIALIGGTDASGTAAHDIWLYEPYYGTGRLVSPVLDAGFLQAHWATLTVDADTPPGSDLTFGLRIADDTSGWTDPIAGWTVVAPTAPLPGTLPRGRYAQLKVQLVSSVGGATPMLRSAELAFEPQ